MRGFIFFSRLWKWCRVKSPIKTETEVGMIWERLCEIRRVFGFGVLCNVVFLLLWDFCLFVVFCCGFFFFFSWRFGRKTELFRLWGSLFSPQNVPRKYKSTLLYCSVLRNVLESREWESWWEDTVWQEKGRTSKGRGLELMDRGSCSARADTGSFSELPFGINGCWTWRLFRPFILLLSTWRKAVSFFLLYFIWQWAESGLFYCGSAEGL